LNISVAQAVGLGTTHLTGADTVIVSDTAANISTAFDALNSITEIDKIVVTDSAGHKVLITMAQAGSDTRALGELYQSDGTTPAGVDISDASAPATTVATLAFSADTGASSTDFITKTAAQTISGTLSANPRRRPNRRNLARQRRDLDDRGGERRLEHLLARRTNPDGQRYPQGACHQLWRHRDGHLTGLRAGHDRAERRCGAGARGGL
jgi:hypothetical protein